MRKIIVGFVLVMLICLTLALVGCTTDATSDMDVGDSGDAAESNDTAENNDAAESNDAATEGDTPQPAAAVAEQGYDFYDGAVQYKDLDLGPIPRPEGSLTIGFVAKSFDNEFWVAMKDGAEAAAAEATAMGVDITCDARAAQGERDDQGQLAVMNDMVNKGYDGIMISPITEGNLLPGIEKAIAKDIPMVINNDVFMPQIDVTAGVWHWEGGLLSAEYINDLLGGEGQVAIIQGNLQTPAARSRTDAFVQWFENSDSNVEIIDIQQADWDRMKANNITATWMKTYPELDAIFSNNDTMAMGALEAVKTAEKDIIIVGIDGTSEARESVKAGELTATVDSFPLYLSRISTEMLLRKIGGQTDLPMVIYTPQAIVDASNVDQDPAELIGWTGFKFAD